MAGVASPSVPVVHMASYYDSAFGNSDDSSSDKASWCDPFERFMEEVRSSTDPSACFEAMLQSGDLPDIAPLGSLWEDFCQVMCDLTLSSATKPAPRAAARSLLEASFFGPHGLGVAPHKCAPHIARFLFHLTRQMVMATTSHGTDANHQILVMVPFLLRLLESLSGEWLFVPSAWIDEVLQSVASLLTVGLEPVHSTSSHAATGQESTLSVTLELVRLDPAMNWLHMWCHCTFVGQTLASSLAGKGIWSIVGAIASEAVECLSPRHGRNDDKVDAAGFLVASRKTWRVLLGYHLSSILFPDLHLGKNNNKNNKNNMNKNSNNKPKKAQGPTAQEAATVAADFIQATLSQEAGSLAWDAGVHCCSLYGPILSGFAEDKDELETVLQPVTDWCFRVTGSNHHHQQQLTHSVVALDLFLGQAYAIGSWAIQWAPEFQAAVSSLASSRYCTEIMEEAEETFLDPFVPLPGGRHGYQKGLDTPDRDREIAIATFHRRLLPALVVSLRLLIQATADLATINDDDTHESGINNRSNNNNPTNEETTMRRTSRERLAKSTDKVLQGLISTLSVARTDATWLRTHQVDGGGGSIMDELAGSLDAMMIMRDTTTSSTSTCPDRNINYSTAMDILITLCELSSVTAAILLQYKSTSGGRNGELAVHVMNRIIERMLARGGGDRAALTALSRILTLALPSPGAQSRRAGASGGGRMMDLSTVCEVVKRGLCDLVVHLVRQDKEEHTKEERRPPQGTTVGSPESQGQDDVLTLLLAAPCVLPVLLADASCRDAMITLINDIDPLCRAITAGDCQHQLHQDQPSSPAVTNVATSKVDQKKKKMMMMKNGDTAVSRTAQMMQHVVSMQRGNPRPPSATIKPLWRAPGLLGLPRVGWLDKSLRENRPRARATIPPGGSPFLDEPLASRVPKITDERLYNESLSPLTAVSKDIHEDTSVPGMRTCGTSLPPVSSSLTSSSSPLFCVDPCTFQAIFDHLTLYTRYVGTASHSAIICGTGG